jgi:hypothetical protein
MGARTKVTAEVPAPTEERTAVDEFHEIHKKLFPDGPPEPRTVEQMKEGIERYIREKHARR